MADLTRAEIQSREVAFGGRVKNFAETYIQNVISDAFFDVQMRYEGKPNGSADNFKAVTDAIADCSKNGGGTVYLRPGEWLIDSKIPSTSRCLDLLDNVHLVGAGRGSTTLILGDNVEGAIVSMIDKTNVGVRGLTLDGNRDFQTTGVHTVSCAGCTRYQIEDLDIFRSKSYGIGLQAGTQSWGKIDTIFFEEIGHDGIDFKNPNFTNFGNIICNIYGTSFDLGGGNDGALIDVRGPAIVDGVFFKGSIPQGCTIVRARQNNGVDLDGGHFSQISNVHAVHNDLVNPHRGNVVFVGCDDVQVTQVSGIGTFTVVSTLAGSNRATIANVKGRDVTRMVSLDGADHSISLATGHLCDTTFRAVGDRINFHLCRSFNAVTRGFAVEAGADATEWIDCKSMGDADAYNDAGTNTVKTNSPTLV